MRRGLIKNKIDYLYMSPFGEINLFVFYLIKYYKKIKSYFDNIKFPRQKYVKNEKIIRL